MNELTKKSNSEVSLAKASAPLFDFKKMLEILIRKALQMVRPSGRVENQFAQAHLKKR